MDNDPTWKDEFDSFVAQLYRRLRSGDEEYGDKSWKNPADMNVKEICEELSDVSGWAFQVWRRMQVLKNRLKDFEKQVEPEKKP